MEKARASLVPVGTSRRGEPVGGGVAVGAHQRADLLDEVEQRPALLPGEGLAEQRAEPADVGPQGGVVPGVWFHTCFHKARD